MLKLKAESEVSERENKQTGKNWRGGTTWSEQETALAVSGETEVKF